MGWTGESDRYGAVAVLLHWASAALVAALLATGLAMDAAAGAVWLLRVHAALGAVLVILTLARIAWWLFADTRPAALGSGLGRRLAGLVHRAMLGLLLVLGASGAGLLLLSGALPVLLGTQPGTLPDLAGLPPRALHGAAAWALIALLGLHIAGAAAHGLILRDGALARMGLGRPPAGRHGAGG